MENDLLSQDTQDKDKTVYILDSYGLIYRAYFALFSHPLTNTKGQNISALVIFFKNLRALIAKYNPSYLAAAFDSRTPTFRHEMYKEYKATRQKTPDDLLAQIPWVEEILNALNVPVLRYDGFEADDVIATVAAKCKEQNRPCRILSADKDLLQLVDENCLAMQPDKANGGWETNGVAEVTEKWGIGPEKILDYLSLVGDTADNVPGVKGVGDKTALKLLSEYGTLEGIYEHDQEIKGALGQKIRADKENAFFSKKLITLRCDVPIDFGSADCCTANLNFKAAGELLEKYGAKQVAQSYLKSAGESPVAKEEKNDEAELKPIQKNKGDYKACTDEKELAAFIDAVLGTNEKTVAFDTETDSLNSLSASLVGFSLSMQEGKAIYVPVILPGGMFAPPTISKKTCLEQLGRLINDEGVTLVMHNGKYDLEVLHANGLTDKIRCRIADTMVAAWLLDPGALGKTPYGLEYLAEKFLGLVGIEFSDVVQKGSTFADVPLEQAFPYGAEDADFTLKLWHVFEKKLNDASLTDLFFNMEMKVLPILTSMEIQGIHLDKNTLALYSVELAQEIEHKKEEIYGFVGHEFNISSTKQLQTVLFEERGLVPEKKTKTGYSTDTSVLEELAERTDDPVPKAILDYRSYTKLQSTYVEVLPSLADKNERIHTSFIQVGTATGRLSSRDPNLQNIPIREEAGRRIRSAFTAVPGTVLISADYAQIELVILAHLSGDENLSRAFIEGTDVHKSTAALIYGIEADQVTPQMRRFAKTVNFGVMYGMSAFRLAGELGITRTEAQNFINQYFTTYAKVKEFIDGTIEKAKSDGFVETIMGRRRYIPDILSRNKNIQQSASRIAVNTPIQGSAADIVKKAMIEVQSALDSSNSPAKMLLQVHDELIFECPDDEQTIKSTIDLIKTKMEGAVKLSVPLRASIEYGRSWGEFH